MGCDFLLKDKGTLSAAKLLPAVLSVIAGSCDVIGFLGLGGLFTAHVTGNLVILAAHILSGEAAQVAPMLSVPVFMVALGLTRLVAAGCERAGLAPLRPLLALQLILLVAFLAFGVAAGPVVDPNGAHAVLAGMFGVSAMAVQNALVPIALKGVPSTAVMTTNITRFTVDLVELLVGRNAEEIERARHQARQTPPRSQASSWAARWAGPPKSPSDCGRWHCRWRWRSWRWVWRLLSRVAPNIPCEDPNTRRGVGDLDRSADSHSAPGTSRFHPWQAESPFVIAGAHTALVPGSSVVEQPAVNRLVAGSNPARGAKFNSPITSLSLRVSPRIRSNARLAHHALSERQAPMALTGNAQPAPQKAAKKAASPITAKHLAARLAADHDMSKRQGMAMLGDLVALITKHLKKGERIKIAGFGILQVRKRAARMGRNPATGEAIKIKASKKVAFRAAKDLKTAIAA